MDCIAFTTTKHILRSQERLLDSTSASHSAFSACRDYLESEGISTFYELFDSRTPTKTKHSLITTRPSAFVALFTTITTAMPSSHRIARVLLPLSLVSSTFALNALTYVGCFSSSNGLTESSTFQYQSSGHCQETCVGAGNQAVLGLTNGNDCYCGSQTPPSSAKVSDSNCNTPCTGYGQDTCGSNGFWSVYLTGVSSNVGSASGSGSSGSSSSSSPAPSSSANSLNSQTTNTPTQTTAQPSVVTSIAPGKTVIVTETPVAQTSTVPASTATSQQKSKSSNTVAIAVGVVVGVVAGAAIVGFVIFFVRRRRSQRDSNAWSGSETAGKTQIPAMRRIPGPESRIDPEALANHRMSDGSIADNEDYSRRILKVCHDNPGRVIFD